MRLGERLGSLLTAGDVIALIGELGAGKTTLVKGIAQGLGVEDKRAVKSPTFSLMNRYEGRIPIYHFDAYRLEDARDMIEIGSDEIFFGNGVSIVEWADKVFDSLPKEHMKILFTSVSENERDIEIHGYGKHYHEILKILRVVK